MSWSKEKIGKGIERSPFCSLYLTSAAETAVEPVQERRSGRGHMQSFALLV